MIVQNTNFYFMAKKEIKKTEDNASVNEKESKSIKTSKESNLQKTPKKKEAKSKTTASKSESTEDVSIEVVEALKKPKTEKSSDEFLKEFDWHNYEEGIEKVDEKKQCCGGASGHGGRGSMLCRAALFTGSSRSPGSFF